MAPSCPPPVFRWQFMSFPTTTTLEKKAIRLKAKHRTNGRHTRPDMIHTGSLLSSVARTRPSPCVWGRCTYVCDNNKVPKTFSRWKFFSLRKCVLRGNARAGLRTRVSCGVTAKKKKSRSKSYLCFSSHDFFQFTCRPSVSVFPGARCASSSSLDTVLFLRKSPLFHRCHLGCSTIARKRCKKVLQNKLNYCLDRGTALYGITRVADCREKYKKYIHRTIWMGHQLFWAITLPRSTSGGAAEEDGGTSHQEFMFRKKILHNSPED